MQCTMTSGCESTYGEPHLCSQFYANQWPEWIVLSISTTRRESFQHGLTDFECWMAWSRPPERRSACAILRHTTSDGMIGWAALPTTSKKTSSSSGSQDS